MEVKLTNEFYGSRPKLLSTGIAYTLDYRVYDTGSLILNS